MATIGTDSFDAAAVSSHGSSGIDESELVARARTCPEAFGQLYESYYDQILNYLYRHTLDVNTAEELTSNTFFKALRGLVGYRDQGMFRAWLYRIATNELKMHWRRQRKQKLEHELRPPSLERICVDSLGTCSVDDVEQVLASAVQLKAAMDRLPGRYRSAIALRYLEDMSYDEVAQVLGKRLGTVKSLVHRGLARLRRLLENDSETQLWDLHFDK